MKARLLPLALLGLGAIGCESTRETEPDYRAAQGCFAIRSEFVDRYLRTTPEGGYQLTADPEQADHFFAKPSGLGRYLFHDQDRGHLALAGGELRRADRASEDSEWALNGLDILRSGLVVDSKQTLVATKRRHRLLAGEGGISFMPAGFKTIPTEAAFELEPRPAEECAAFPEASLDADIDPAFFEARDPADPVVGFADLHTHLGFPKSMGSVVMAGDLFHPFGIEHALRDCAHLHGPNGRFDLLGLQTGNGNHATAGYPTFPDWPNRSTPTHTIGYYRWLERAHLSGLRLAVTLATGNQSLCQLAGIIHLNELEGDCSPIQTVERQTRYLYELQDYVDAQAGGPGKGWFRVVTSPAQAREVIAQNKLAVVLGIEYNLLFDCRTGKAACTPDYLDEQLDAIHELGIRSVYPIHRFDNAFGGTDPGPGTRGAWMNLGNKFATGRVKHIADLANPFGLLFEPIGGSFWELDHCPAGAEGRSGFRDMNLFLDEDFGVFRDALLDLPTVGPVLAEGFDLIFFDKLDPVPDYAEFQGQDACNPRGLQPVGRHLVHRMIDKGMIVEIDHLSDATLQDVLEILEQRNYSGFISSHGWTKSWARDRIFALGGIRSPFSSEPASFAGAIDQQRLEMAPYPFAAGMAMASDMQGVRGQPGGDADFVPTYPFRSADGLVTFHRPRTGERTFDFAQEGLAHYGLLPEWVENLRQVSEDRGDGVFETFMQSAEAYLQMWERAEAAAVP